MSTVRGENDNNEEEYLRLLAALAPDERLRLLDKDFNLERQLLQKRQYRRALAQLSSIEKLRLLEELRKRSEIQKGVRKAPSVKLPPATAKGGTDRRSLNSFNQRKRRPIRLKSRQHRFGGRATAGGVGYEVRIAAFVATKMLAGDRCSVWDGISGADIASITLQAAEEVDDVVVGLTGGSGASVFISAKERAKTIPLTAKSPAFADTIDAFVRQFLNLPPDSSARSRFIWAIPSSAGKSAAHDLPLVLDSHREDDSATLLDFLRTRQTRERHAFDALISETKRSWKKRTGKLPSKNALREFLRLIYVEVYEFETGQKDERKAEDTLRSFVLADPKQMKRAWQKLEHLFGRADQRGVCITPMLLRRALVADGLKLKAAPSYADDIALLNTLTVRNLARLKGHTVLPFGPKSDEEVHIARTEELAAMVDAVKRGDLLITGEPGCGKSGLVHPLVQALQSKGTPVVLLLAEEIFGRDWKGSANVPGLTHALDDVLANWPNGAQGVLVTDALDAVRDVETQRILRQLLHDVQGGTSGWTVVASVREFDLKHGRELRESFPGDGVAGHSSSEFAGVSHFHVTGLTDSKLDELAAQITAIGPFIASARKNLRASGFYRSPFFLRLAAELLKDGVSPTRLADWSSPAVLLRRFWKMRVMDGAGTGHRKVALQTICGRMTELRSMTLATQEVSLGSPELEAIDELRSRGILQSPVLRHGNPVGEDDVRFSHHLLHDYAIARSLIPSSSSRFADFAVRQPLMPIFYRQSFLFALEELWDGPDGRDGFWRATLNMESVAQLHGITRILAPILAARRVDTAEDLRPLFDAVRAGADDDSAAQKALGHMASGLQDVSDDAMRAGSGAWCLFAADLSRLLQGRPSLETPVVHILARLNAVSDSFSPRDLRELNEAARHVLAHHVAKKVSQGWRYAARTATETLCRTFTIAPSESEAALLSMLTPERLADFPHWDLFDFAHQLKHLDSSGDGVVLRLFEAAFATEPKSDEWEDFGGRIMPLRMQRRDNWHSVQYSLTGYYESAPGTDAGLMTDIACIAWNAAVRRRSERRESGDGLIARFHFRGVECELREDYGHIWGRRHDYEESRILTRFEALLEKWVIAGDMKRVGVALDHLAVRNQTSQIWMLIMELGAKHPTTLGEELEPILDESLFLTHPDYSYGGISLFAALHKEGDTTQREHLEKIALNLPQTARFLRDEPRDPMPGWLQHSQNKLLGAVKESDIVLNDFRVLRSERAKCETLPENQAPKVFEVSSHTFSDAELVERRGVSLKDPANAKLFQLREALQLFREHNGKKVDVSRIEENWEVIGQTERALRRYGKSHPAMAEDLWGYLVGACESIVSHARWPQTDRRWKTIRGILLKASTDPSPKVSKNELETEDHWPTWGWPAPRIDAARALLLLAYRIGRADRMVSAALLRLSRDKSHPLRFNMGERLAALEQAAPKLMWQLIDRFIRYEHRFSVLEAVVLSLDRLWWRSPDAVKPRLARIAERAMRSASDDNHIHETLAHTYLFRFLRTGDADCEAFIDRLIAECDRPRASHALGAQLHNCRKGGWLTAGDAVKIVSEEEVMRQRTWAFFSKLLSVAQTKLQLHRKRLEELHAVGQMETEEAKRVKEAMNSSAQLVDGIAAQLYFASGAFADKQNKDQDHLTEPQKRRYWKESESLFEALAAEMHPHTAHQLVEALHHLLPCSPRKVFLIAAKAITTSSRAGFQHESIAVSDVVRLIQRALADHREIFQSIAGKQSDCLTALLKVLDLFVEAGWAEARQLTHRLEEIYR